MANAWSFGDMITYFQDIGVYEYFLPFLLVFAIIFAVLEKTKLFGPDKERINAVIAFVIGLVLIAQQSIVETINMFLPRVSLLFVIILMGLLLISMIGGKEFSGLTGGVFVVMVIVVVVFVVLALSPSLGWETGFFDYYFSSYELAALGRIAIPLLIFLVCIWFMFGKSGGDGEDSKFGKGIGKFFTAIEKGSKGER